MRLTPTTHHCEQGCLVLLTTTKETQAPGAFVPHQAPITHILQELGELGLILRDERHQLGISDAYLLQQIRQQLGRLANLCER